jgi:hypothetical protein
MAFDVATSQSLLFAGLGAGPAFAELEDTWTWNGVDWMQPLGLSPTAREQHAVAFDLARSQIVLFGGISGGKVLADTWVWQ